MRFLETFLAVEQETADYVFGLNRV